MSRHIPNIRYLFLILTAALLCLSSCRDRKDIIPKGTMSKIYYDIYMTDEAVDANYGLRRIEAVDANYGLRRMADTMRIYEPIFNKYGYTTEDYNRSVNFYLERPDKFEDVFEDTKTMLEKRKAELNVSGRLSRALHIRGRTCRYGLQMHEDTVFQTGLHHSRLPCDRLRVYGAPRQPVPDIQRLGSECR